MVLARGAKGAGALVVGASDSNQGEQQPAVDGSDEDEAASVEVRRASHRLSSCPVHTCGGDAPTFPRDMKTIGERVPWRLLCAGGS
jgi:hypothetical protein